MRRAACPKTDSVSFLRSAHQHPQSPNERGVHSHSPPNRESLDRFWFHSAQSAMKSEALLLVSDSDHDANMLYAVGMFVPDAFIYLRIGARKYVVMSDLEIDRARRLARGCTVLSLSEYQRKLRREGVKNPG